MKVKQYITTQQLEGIGFRYDTEALQSLLDTVNKKIAEQIDAEIRIEIEYNYDADLLAKYLALVDKHEFSSNIVQHWLEEHIAAFHEITTDRINIMLANIDSVV
ncbi:MAG: hypothetical protein LBH36_01165 [Candidatus Nomurabacteria bacterium]|jgi:hypothetical protein|nr:hypothetical protein [Candidatus Nomurabacteria bacterium]